ncbi:MAG: hypothetical protein ACJ8EJ_10045 [Xanthobacteraceae bacterium]
MTEATRMPAAVPAALRAIVWGSVRLIVILGVLLAWELTARSGLVTPFMLPRFSAVLERIWADAASGELAVNVGLTLYRAMVGFLGANGSYEPMFAVVLTVAFLGFAADRIYQMIVRRALLWREQSA